MNNRRLRAIGLLLLGLLAALWFGPFLIPIPPLPDVQPVGALADPDSEFIQLDGIAVHYKRAGAGQPALVLLHGFGASLYSWRTVTPALAEDHAVYAYDRPAFGLTERPVDWEGENPYGLAANLARLAALLDFWGVEQAVLVGNSAGGTLALEFALAYPERVAALVLVSPALGGGGGPYARFDFLFNLPQMNRLGQLLVRGIADSGMDILESAWHDPTRQPPDTTALYRKPLQAENWDVGLWQFTRAAQPSDLPDRLGLISQPTLVITGDDDRIIPTESSIAAAGQIPGAQLVVIPACGHVPQEECPDEFLAAVQAFLADTLR